VGEIIDPVNGVRTMKMMARVCFHASDAKPGIAALRRHGFTVLTHVFPEEPDYIFAEAVCDGDSSTDKYELTGTVLDEVSSIVEPFYCHVSDAGPVHVGHVPFEYETAAWRGHH
jgi:hypothetical protein